MINKLLKIFFKEKPTETAAASTIQETVQIKEPKVTKKPRKPKKVDPPKPELSAKDQATMADEPYVSIVKVDIDPNNINNGMFELDWNDKFVINLIKSGYKIKDTDTDMEIVDRWFTQVCRNIALELYEQVEADPQKRDDIRIVNTRDIGNGRSEIS